MRLSTHIKDAYRYFFPPRRFRKVPNQLISPYKMKGATRHERLLMKYGVARSPDESKRMMNHYQAQTAWEVIEQIPVKEISLWSKLKWRLLRLIRTIEGHDPRNPYKMRGSDIDFKYRYRR